MAVQPLVSVVTPVYNGAEYLAQCIESVLAQKYQKWYYTIVNNCSTDGTAEIACRYASKDPRIRVHHNREFLPIVANHNEALRQSSLDSKYCKLVFADDWLFPECLERMVALGEAHPSVGLISAYGLRGQEVLWAGLPYPSCVVPGHDVCRQRLLGGPYIFGTGTSHMLRADLVRRCERFYNESNLHCDSEACFQILQVSDFGFIHQILHYTRAPRAESYTMLSHRLRTLEAMTLYELLNYGPIYLTASEFRSRMRDKLEEYYVTLAESALDGGAPWDFHRTKLSEFGLTLDRWHFARALLRAMLAHPRHTAGQLLCRTRVFSSRFWRNTR